MGACSSTTRRKFKLNRKRKHNRKLDVNTDADIEFDDYIYTTIDESTAVDRRLRNGVDNFQLNLNPDDLDQHDTGDGDYCYSGYDRDQESQSSGSENGSNGSRPSTDSAISDISSRSSTSGDPNKNHTSRNNRNSRNTPNRCKLSQDYAWPSTGACNTTRSRLDKVSGKTVSTVDGEDAWVDPSEHTEQMVEIYRPQLESSIRAREIISYLPFIDDREAILQQEPRVAMRRLLDSIAQSEEKGKWTTFLDALKTVGYRYIANLLTGETEGDTTNQTRLVRILEPDIIYRMETSSFIDYLYQDGVIGEMDKEEVQCELKNRGPMAANLRLIELMPRRLEHWCHAFIGTMRKCGMADVADKFESSGVCRQSATETRDIFDTTCSEETSTKTTYLDTSDDDKEIAYIHPENGDATAVRCSNRGPLPLPHVPMEPRTNRRVDLYVEGDATAVKHSKKHPNLPPLPPVPTEIPTEMRTVHPQEAVEQATARNTVKCEPPSRISSLMLQEAALYKRLNEVKRQKEIERNIERLTQQLNSLTTESAEPTERNPSLDKPTIHKALAEVGQNSETSFVNNTAHGNKVSCESDQDSNNREEHDVRNTPDELHYTEDETYAVTYTAADADEDPSNDYYCADMDLAADGRITAEQDDGYDRPSDTDSNTEKYTFQELNRVMNDIKEEVDGVKIHIAKEIEKNLQPIMAILEKIKCLPVTHVQSDSSDNYIIIDRPIGHQKHRRQYESGIGTLDIEDIYI